MTVKQLASGTLFVVAVAFLGLMVGAFLGGRVFASGMGWDRLADMLGGVALGAGSGLVFSLSMVKRLSVAKRIRWSLVAVGASALVVLLLVLLPKKPIAISPTNAHTLVNRSS